MPTVEKYIMLFYNISIVPRTNDINIVKNYIKYVNANEVDNLGHCDTQEIT